MKFIFSVLFLIVAAFVTLICGIFSLGWLTVLKILGSLIIGWWVFLGIVGICFILWLVCQIAKAQRP